MHRKILRKPDGRELVLYSRRPVSDDIVATSPAGDRATPNPHLRWHPLRGEWVAFASYRQNRVFLPPKQYNPLAPTRSDDSPTELPRGDYDVAVFENLSPALSPESHDPESSYVATAPAAGRCEVIVFSPDPETSLGKLPLAHVKLILDVWADRYDELGKNPAIHYVMPFENRGVEVGVTLHHPHGQLYAYPFVPPVPAREIAEQKKFLDANGTTLLGHVIEGESKDGRRILYASEKAVAFVPAFARYPYEVWVAPRRAASSLSALDNEERTELARALKTVLLKYDGLWRRPFPYLMVLHQAPTDRASYPEVHFHFEFSPPYRTSERLKYLAGTELGAGMFANDALPEAKAAELRGIEVTLE